MPVMLLKRMGAESYEARLIVPRGRVNLETAKWNARRMRSLAFSSPLYRDETKHVLRDRHGVGYVAPWVLAH